MIDLNKTLALVLWSKDEDGEEEVAVFSGLLVKNNDTYFLKRENEENSEILKEWLPRINKTPEDLKEILMNCEYQLTLSIGDIDEVPETYESFGLKWPQNK